MASQASFAAGFIDEATVWRYADAGAAMARGGFQGWEEWGGALLDGRVLWGGEARSYYEAAVRKLLEDANSVWNRVSWQEATSG